MSTFDENDFLKDIEFTDEKKFQKDEKNEILKKDEIKNEIVFVDISKLSPHPKNNILLPTLTKTELQRLKNRIKQYGFNENIEITKNFVILDGHHRFKILTEFQKELKINKIPCRIIDIDEDEEANYIISKNYDRRQLSKLIQSYIRGKQYNGLKKEHGGNRKKSSGQNVQLNTSKSLSERFGINEKTIRRDGAFSKMCDELIMLTSYEFVFDILNGEIKANKSIITLLSKQPNSIIEKVFKLYKEQGNEIALKDAIETIKKHPEDNVSKKKSKKNIIEVDDDVNDLLEKLSKKLKKDKNEALKDVIKKGLEL